LSKAHDAAGWSSLLPIRVSPQPLLSAAPYIWAPTVTYAVKAAPKKSFILDLDESDFDSHVTPRRQRGADVKESLTVDQIVRLLPGGAWRKLLFVRSVQLNGVADMSNIYLFRVAQGLLAVAATGVSVLALQLAMLA
jgi:hypothetical protein